MVGCYKVYHSAHTKGEEHVCGLFGEQGVDQDKPLVKINETLEELKLLLAANYDGMAFPRA